MHTVNPRILCVQGQGSRMDFYGAFALGAFHIRPHMIPNNPFLGELSEYYHPQLTQENRGWDSSTSHSHKAQM